MPQAYTFLMYNINMNEKYFQEFSNIYCRLMRLEILMKKKLISSLLSYYKARRVAGRVQFFAPTFGDNLT